MNKGRLLNAWFAGDLGGINFRHRGNDIQWSQQRVVNEVLAYELQRQVGLATPRLRHVCLWINGVPTITTELEDPEEAYLTGNSLSINDYVSRSGYGGRGMVAGDATLDNFKTATDLLNSTGGAGKYDCVRTNLCYESVMYSLGLLSLTGNGDQHFSWNMIQHRSAADGRWRQYPWDADISFDPSPYGAAFEQTTLHPYYQTALHPTISGGVYYNMLGQTLFYPETGADAEYTLPYRHRQQMLLWRYFYTLYATNHLFQRLDALQTDLTPAFSQIGADPALLSNQVQTVKTFITNRRDFYMNGAWSDKNTNIWNTANVYNPSNVVINEIMYQPVSGSEYIELYNPGSQTIDLSWWTLTVASESYHLPQGTMLGAGKYLVITDKEQGLTNAYAAFSVSSNLVERYPGYGLWDWPVVWTSATEYATRIVQLPQLSLPDAGAAAVLTDLQGHTIDSVTYSNAAPWPLASPGVSVELIDAGSDNAMSSHWHLCLQQGTPGEPNTNPLPGIGAIDDHSAPAGSAYSVTPLLTNGVFPVTWSFVGSRPAGMTINSSSGGVDWASPTPAGQTFSITIRATNSFGFDDEQWNLLVTSAGVVATPQFSPAPGSYLDELDVTITDATPGAVIRYTTNGTDPTTSDTIIASGGKVRIIAITALKARAWKSDWTESAIRSGTYTIPEPRVAILSRTSSVIQGKSNVAITVRAIDADGLTQVRLYDGTNLIGITNLSAGIFYWSNTFVWAMAPAGNHSLTAQASDIYGNACTSSVTVFQVRSTPVSSKLYWQRPAGQVACWLMNTNGTMASGYTVLSSSS
ncbi:MAG: lamin tail domain-containing protein, partial [bacterium]